MKNWVNDKQHGSKDLIKLRSVEKWRLSYTEPHNPKYKRSGEFDWPSETVEQTLTVWKTPYRPFDKTTKLCTLKTCTD